MPPKPRSRPDPSAQNAWAGDVPSPPRTPWPAPTAPETTAEQSDYLIEREYAGFDPRRIYEWSDAWETEHRKRVGEPPPRRRLAVDCDKCRRQFLACVGLERSVTRGVGREAVLAWVVYTVGRKNVFRTHSERPSFPESTLSQTRSIQTRYHQPGGGMLDRTGDGIDCTCRCGKRLVLTYRHVAELLDNRQRSSPLIVRIVR